jgi:FkbM family methyltransferase
MKGLRIGIVWQGSKANATDRRRSFPLTTLAPLARLHGVSLVSLQKGHGSEQLERLTEFEVHTLGEDFDSSGGAFLDTAAVMQCLDLVITADTSVAHVAGALGVPVWVALAYVPDWRWTLSGERTPWYPSMRLFRQTRLSDWQPVIQQMVEALRKEHPSLRYKQPSEYHLATSGFNRLARTRHGLALYNRHDAYIGKSLDQLGEFSEGETDVFRQLIKPGAVVVEAGANIGAHTLVLAQLAGEKGQVHAIEPQRILFQTLCANMALNSLTNVFCHQAAAGQAPGTLVVPPMDYQQANNFGGLSLGSYREGERVPVITIDSLHLARCDFLKIDVEGMELEVIRGARETINKHRPILYVENDRQEKSPALIEELFRLGYKLFWHLPPYYRPQNYYANPQNPFGSVISINMLGIHQSIVSNIHGLKPVESPHSDWRTR